MAITALITASCTGFGTGLLWYGHFRRQWRHASGVPCNRQGDPRNAHDTLPHFLSYISALLTAVVLQQVIALSPIDGPWQGGLTGLLLGLLLVTPWMAMNYSHAMRPWRLTLIDGGYAVLGPAVIGFVLELF